MSIGYQTSDGSLTEDVDASGGAYILAGAPADPSSSGSLPQQKLYVTPTGQILQLDSAGYTGLQVSQNEISFDGADQQPVTLSLPQPLAVVPQGDFAAAPSGPSPTDSLDPTTDSLSTPSHSTDPLSPTDSSPSPATPTPDSTDTWSTDTTNWLNAISSYWANFNVSGAAAGSTPASPYAQAASESKYWSNYGK